MKKTVQIITIPLDKEGWNKDDIILCVDAAMSNSENIGTLEIARYDYPAQNPYWEAQQLLVLSNDEPNPNHSVLVSNVKDDFEKLGLPINKGYINIVASYPQLPNTLPISKETVQAWINSGTPVEGSVLINTECPYPGNNCTCVGKCKAATNKPKLDPQGNLLLEFAEEIYPVEEAILQALEENHLPIDDDFAERNVAGAIFGAEWQKEQNKPSIPTDEEIEQKAHNEYPYGYTNSIGSYDRSRYETKKESYILGYKQALKDLGHIKNTDNIS